jgi:hypothetical protein
VIFFPSLPVDARSVHVEGGQLLRFSQLSDHYIATVGQADLQLKVTYIKSKQPALTASLQVLTAKKYLLLVRQVGIVLEVVFIVNYAV